MIHSRLGFAAALAASILLGCRDMDSQPPENAAPLHPGQVLAANATVRFRPVEGGCWALETSEGQYEPLSLPPAFKVDGLAVYVVVHGPAAAASICMIAPLVVLDSIRAR